MENRNELLLQFRGNALGINSEATLFEEAFQNNVLRPILKLQNEILINTFKNYIKSHKDSFSNSSVAKKMDFIDQVFQKDTVLKNTFKGMILGLFTLEEIGIYFENSSKINKRLMSMLIERLKSQIQLLE